VTVTTVRISPPKPPKSKRGKTVPTPREELERFFRTYRVALLPFLIMLWLALVTVIVQQKTDIPALIIALTLAGIEFFIWWKGHLIGAIRPRERQYAFAIPAVGALWALYATLGDQPVQSDSLAGLVVLTALTALPWWHHRRVRGSVKVTFEHLPKRVRDVRLKETKRLITGWTAYTSAGRIQGSRIRGLTFNEWSVALHVRLRNGAHTGELQRPSRRRHLESASYWPVSEGSVRIAADDGDSRNCTIRYMLRDPHAESILPDEEEIPTADNLIIGLFETGASVLFALVNTLIAGETGTGKSNLINRIIQLVAKVPTIAILGVDATPGATEFGPWRGVMHTLANTADEIDKLFTAILIECDRRGTIMQQHRWKNFRVTKQDPFMCLIVDEVQRVKSYRLDGKLGDITAVIRKYGGCVIVATQYPTGPNVPKTITANLPQRIGLRTVDGTGDRVIFGDSATRNGWTPSTLIPEGRKGSFLIRSEHYSKPILARCHAIDEDLVERESTRWSPQRTSIVSINLRAVPTVERDEIQPGSVLTLEERDHDEIVEAEIMDDTETILVEMIEREINTPTKIQKELENFGKTLTVRTVNRYLRSLAERGYIRQLRKQGPWYRS
jgi:DNA translocase FtsK/SpoIIIE-like protein